MGDQLKIKVITSDVNTDVHTALETAFNNWLANVGNIEIQTVGQSESIINSSTHVTMTILYREL